jgi:hypothetical protein
MGLAGAPSRRPPWDGAQRPRSARATHQTRGGRPGANAILAGTKGGRLATQITVTLDLATAKEPPTARVTAVKFDGPLPGRILLSPQELERAAQR